MAEPALAVSNPYLEAFEKVVERREEGYWPRWEYRGRARVGEERTPESLDAIVSGYAARDELTKRYAWAVPNAAALARIAGLGMAVVEMGAGTGYWASLLRAMGVEVAAFDEAPGDSHWCEGLHGEVEVGTPEILREERWRDHALLLCWPPYEDTMAADAVELFTGDVLVFVGEGFGGCTGGADFWRTVTGEQQGEYDDEGNYAEPEPAEPAWREEAELAVELPQWPGMRDYLRVFRRL